MTDFEKRFLNIILKRHLFRRILERGIRLLNIGIQIPVTIRNYFLLTPKVFHTWAMNREGKNPAMSQQSEIREVKENEQKHSDHFYSKLN